MDLLIALGGNLGEPRRALRTAIGELGRRHLLLGVSRLYRTRAVGPPQPDFLNLVVLLRPATGLLELLVECQKLERAAGRDRARESRWGPRPLDLDLLLADGLVHRGPRLVVPHPRLDERAFALVPAAELVPAWIHPLVGRRLAELAEEALAADPGAVESLGPLEA